MRMMLRDAPLGCLLAVGAACSGTGHGTIAGPGQDPAAGAPVPGALVAARLVKGESGWLLQS